MLVSGELQIIAIFVHIFEISHEMRGLIESYLYAKGSIGSVILPKWKDRRNHFKEGLKGCVAVKSLGGWLYSVNRRAYYDRWLSPKEGPLDNSTVKLKG